MNGFQIMAIPRPMRSTHLYAYTHEEIRTWNGNAEPALHFLDIRMTYHIDNGWKTKAKKRKKIQYGKVLRVFVMNKRTNRVQCSSVFVRMNVNRNQSHRRQQIFGIAIESILLDIRWPLSWATSTSFIYAFDFTIRYVNNFLYVSNHQRTPIHFTLLLFSKPNIQIPKIQRFRWKGKVVFRRFIYSECSLSFVVVVSISFFRERINGAVPFHVTHWIFPKKSHALNFVALCPLWMSQLGLTSIALQCSSTLHG